MRGGAAPPQEMMRVLEPLIPALRRYARALLRNRDAADDLVQDCLLRVVGHWQQRRADGNIRSWVFAILHNLALNQMRQSARRGTHLTLDDAGEAALSHPPIQESGLMSEGVLRALAALSPEHRSVLLLISVEDLSYAEAARVLDVPVGTVMSRLARARDGLEALLREDGDRPERRPSLRRVK